MANEQKKKLAILGGGVGSIVSAFEITSNPNWKDTYADITLYQMGWRIGGKGASGRRGETGRIEEHGLHIWLGCYNNAFDAMQRAYKELNRPPGTPLATWQDAYKQHSYIVLAQEYKGEWTPWAFDFPTDNQIPGKGTILPTVWEFIGLTIGWMKSLLYEWNIAQYKEAHKNHEGHIGALQLLKNFVKDEVLQVEVGSITLAEDILTVLIKHIERLDPDPKKHDPAHHAIIIKLLEELSNWLRRELLKLVDDHLDIKRFTILMDTGATTVTGMMRDGVLLHPNKLDSLDGEDLCEWLARHGALEITYRSPLMKGLYDLVFAYRNGEIEKPDFAAGTALRVIFRIVFTYKGAVFWKMQAGMGDTVFTPFYEVLKKRGVKFKFFHRVDNLGLSADGTSISTITIGRQATVKNGVAEEYDPIVNVADLDCWPSYPNYDQLVEGDALKAQDINLESFYTPWKDVESITLQVGKDFDDVVFGISLGSIPYVCKELLVKKEWKDMVENLLSVRTMAFQTWMNKDLKELGWNDQSPVMDAYVDPMNTWADMSQLIDKETWPASANIRNVSYFCGPMEGGIPPQSETWTPEEALKVVKEASDPFLKNDMKVWWTKDVDAKGGFDESSVVDIFYRANIDPSERYVLSVKGSTQYRLRGDNSGFSNLYLAGDWTVNGINAGCVEATAMSGMVVSHALIGTPRLEDIEGLVDL